MNKQNQETMEGDTEEGWKLVKNKSNAGKSNKSNNGIARPSIKPRTAANEPRYCPRIESSQEKTPCRPLFFPWPRKTLMRYWGNHPQEKKYL
jgi:hypothetical protein